MFLHKLTYLKNETFVIFGPVVILQRVVDIQFHNSHVDICQAERGHHDAHGPCRCHDDVAAEKGTLLDDKSKVDASGDDKRR